MIPVLIVPVLNRYDLLDKMLASIDHPVKEVIIINNGSKYLDDGQFPHTFTINLPHNIGVGAAWNLGMKVTPKAPWWTFVGSDVEWGPGDLANLARTVDPWAPAVYAMDGMSAFAMTYETIRAVGYFDENFHPAYDEDLDYARRVTLCGAHWIEVGFTGKHVGSATIFSDELLRYLNHKTHPANDRYYARKWGGEKLGGETYDRPFGSAQHVGDWRLDPARLRDQAWPRR